MLIIAIIIGAIGSGILAIGKSRQSALASLCGGLMCLCSGVLFILNIFMIW